MSKVFKAAIVFVVLGLLSGWAQAQFYGYVDEEGFLHDSFFLPLSFILLFIAAALFLFGAVRWLFSRLKS